MGVFIHPLTDWGFKRIFVAAWGLLLGDPRSGSGMTLRGKRGIL